MVFSYQRLGTGRALDLASAGTDGVHLVSLADRGATAWVPNGWTTVWIALKGRSLVETPAVEIALDTRQSLSWSDGALRATTLRGGWMLGIAAPTALWPVPPGFLPDGPRRAFFSRVAAADRDVLGLLIRMVRERDMGAVAMASLFQAVRGAVSDSQEDIEPWLARCSGHTRARKEQTLQRLMRARNVLIHSHGVDGAIPRLASLARFSPTHFKRLYRHVFGVSPGEHASQLKVEHTWRLVTSTTLNLVDVCEAAGFESKSAFCRKFKQRFGVTTTQARESHETMAKVA